MAIALRRAVLVLALLACVAGAFAAGGSAYRLARRNQQARGPELYESVLRIAGRSPLSLPYTGLAKQTDLRPLDLFSNVERRLRANYYEKIGNDSTLAYGTADNMVDSLGDPYSRFLEPDQLKAYGERLQGDFRGIGAVLAARKEQVDETADSQRRAQAQEDESAWPAYDDPVDLNSVGRSPDGTPQFRYEVFILSTAPGGPAEAAGLRAGDTIRKVNGKYIFTKNLDTLDRMLLMPTEGTVKLAVKRAGTAKPIDVSLTMRETHVQPVTATVTNGVGVVGLRTLGPGTAAAVRAKVAEMVAAHVAGVVLDLRRNGEGDFDEALSVAGSLVPSGTVAWLKEQGGKMRAIPAPAGATPLKVGRLALLVDDTTAGPAELVAAAVKAHGAGRLLGTTTQGLGGRQEFFRMPGESAMLITTGLFLGPTPDKPALVEGKGVVPDVAVTARDSAKDQALERAMAWIKDGGAA